MVQKAVCIATLVRKSCVLAGLKNRGKSAQKYGVE